MTWRREEEFDCPVCGARVEELVEIRAATLEEPAELGCGNCTRPRYGSRAWRLARDEAQCDERYDAWKDSGKPGGRYSRR